MHVATIKRAAKAVPGLRPIVRALRSRKPAPGKIVPPIVDGRPTPLGVEDVIAARPDWVKRQIHDDEARTIAEEMVVHRAVSAIELGVASGHSTSVLYAALSQVSKTPALHSLDWAEYCYFDKSRKTGDAFYEVVGPGARFSLTTGVHSGMLESVPRCDFAFIDANHQNPWPALDLLSLGRFLKPGALVALHDVEMIFYTWGRHASGARDLYRVWLGNKWRREGATNVGFIEYDRNVMLRSLPAALMTDWDTSLSKSKIDQFVRIAKGYGDAAMPIVAALRARADSARHMKPLPGFIPAQA